MPNTSLHNRPGVMCCVFWGACLLFEPFCLITEAGPARGYKAHLSLQCEVTFKHRYWGIPDLIMMCVNATQSVVVHCDTSYLYPNETESYKRLLKTLSGKQ